MAEEQKKRRIRITHDGSMRALDMRIVDAETGEPIRWVKRVEIVADAKGEISAIITVHAPELDLLLDAEVRTSVEEA